jgi:hypothetical protein
MSKEAMKLALEALKNAHSCTAQEYDNAIKALEEALAQQRPSRSDMTWVGLDEQQRNELEDYCEMTIGKAAFDAIEAKLKAKNFAEEKNT